jgi:hypothetical protein
MSATEDWFLAVKKGESFEMQSPQQVPLRSFLFVRRLTGLPQTLQYFAPINALKSPMIILLPSEL